MKNMFNRKHANVITDDVTMTSNKSHGENNYFRPSQTLFKKESILGPVTALAITTLKNANDKCSNAIFCSRGPWIELNICNSLNSEEKQSFTYLAFDGDDSGTIHNIQQCVGGPFLFGKNRIRTQSCPWMIYGGRKMALCFVDIQRQEDNSLHSPFDPLYFSSKGDGASDKPTKLGKTHTFTDWIYDLRSIVVSPGTNSTSDILTAVGLAHNTVEIWKFSSSENNESVVLSTMCLRKIVSDLRCITYSLSFFGWKPESSLLPLSMWRSEDLYLAVGVGTVMNTILIWNVLDEDECHSLKRDFLNCSSEPNDAFKQIERKHVIHRLIGHDGVIFSTKFGHGGSIVASTSDDRTIRVWRQLRIGDNTSNPGVESACDAQLICDKHKSFSLLWTGYGHSARCWDSAFYSSLLDLGQNMQGVASVGEDSTVRLWNLEDGKEVACLKGHSSQSIWRVESDLNNTLVTGGNDGSLKIWNVPYHLSNNATATQYISQNTIHVPLDDVSCSDFNEELTNQCDAECVVKKRKNNALSVPPRQIMFGTCLYPKDGGNKMLLTTKCGMVKTLDLTTREWYTHGPWGRPGRLRKIDHDVDSTSGLSMAIHPSCLTFAVGTSKGDIIISSLSDFDNPIKMKFSLTNYPAIQELKWIDSKTLLACHIKGICVLWSFSQEPSCVEEHIIAPSHRILTMKKEGRNVGNIICHLFDSRHNGLFVGDSRGNIAYFDLGITNEGFEEQNVSCMLSYAHKKEHVTQIIASKNENGIMSVGNDGYIHEIALEKGKNCSLRSLMKIPVSCLTAITHIWRVKTKWQDNNVVGGYRGNFFIVWDVTSSYQLLSVDTGGRNRRLLFSPTFEIGLHPLSFYLVVCLANKTSQNQLLLYSKVLKPSESINMVGNTYSIGTPVHGETILDVSLNRSFKTGRLLLLSGSNDTTVKLFSIESGMIEAVKELPPHESCIRAVCISRHSDSSSALISVCGGKLMSSFYRIDESLNGDISITNLCSTKLPEKPKMDHRMNAVHAIPLLVNENGKHEHLVLAGDSDGRLHLTIVTEDFDQPRKITSHIFSHDIEQRPILCVHMMELSIDWILAAIGNTAGRVVMWLFSKNDLKRNIVPKCPILVYNAHDMGTNCVKMNFKKSRKDDMCQEVCVVSGGDDQGITMCLLEIRPQDHSVTSKELLRTKEACASAIKGIDLAISGSVPCNEARIYAAGYDQRISVWRIIESTEYNNVSLEFLSSCPLDIKDINSMSSFISFGCGGLKQTYLIAGGEGLELLSIDESLFKAAEALKNANFLLITCGAGFSADSGLSTYELMPDKYQDLCNPLRLIDRPLEFQQFWSTFAQTYSNTQPHDGYEILNKWCEGRKLANLIVKDMHQLPWYIYSSNVDSQFDTFKCFQNTVCEIHGRAKEFRCSNAIGFSDGVSRQGALWNLWNNSMTASSDRAACQKRLISVEEEISDSIVRCEFCKAPLRPNVLLFQDTDTNVIDPIFQRRQKYQRWEADVEDQVVNHKMNLVILELGAGVRIPAVREESEEVYRDIKQRLQKSSDDKGGTCTLIRINPKDAHSNIDDCISISNTAKSALKSIDNLL
jgi:WD40 repeat protein/NAD-dependent SIR2 family protein deacetylase